MKRNLLQLGIGFCLGVIFLFSSPVLADPAYNIDRYQVKVALQSDGSAILTQKIKYDFLDEAHGVYYHQALNDQQKLNDISVAVKQNGQTTQLAAKSSGANDTYQTTMRSKLVRLKVFHAVDSGPATFIYRYRINHVVTNWRDTAEMNWKIIGSKWDVALHHVRIVIVLPQKNVRQLQAWTHNQTNGSTQVDRRQGKVVITTAQNPANSFIESRLLFPSKVTADNPLVKKQKRKQQVQQQEAKWAQEANLQRKQARRAKQLRLSLIWGIVAVLFAVSLLFFVADQPVKVKWPRHGQSLPHSFALPSQPAAVVQAILTNARPDTKALGAALLELAAKKQIHLLTKKQKKRFGHSQTDLQVDLLDPAILNVPIWQALFAVAGNGKSFTFSGLKKVGNSNQKSKKLNRAFIKWQKQVQQQAQQQHYLDTQIKQALKYHLLLTFLVIGVAVIGSAVIGNLTGWLIGGGFSLLQLLIHLWFRQTHCPYTASGAQLVEQLRGFKKMLKDIGRFDLKQVGELVLWENVMPYAVAFGIAPQVAQVLAASFDEQTVTNDLFIYYPLFINNPDFDFGTTFSNNFSTGSMVSSNGSSGGFSGGNSGGFGGGSGGGGF